MPIDDPPPPPRPSLRGFLSPVARGIRKAIEHLGQYEFNVLATAMAVVGAVLFFIWIADAVSEGETLRFDEWAVQALRRANDPAVPIGPAWLSEMGRDVTALGGVGFLFLLTAIVAGFLWLQRMYAAMALVVGSTLGGTVVSLVLKSFFDRPRPQLVPHLSIVHTSSFPSGHAMMSSAVFLTLGLLLGQFVDSLRLKAYFFIVALLMTFLVGCSRVYMGVHYPTDVLAGWAAGMAWALACGLVARSLRRRGLVEDLDVTTHNARPESPAG